MWRNISRILLIEVLVIKIVKFNNKLLRGDFLRGGGGWDFYM